MFNKIFSLSFGLIFIGMLVALFSTTVCFLSDKLYSKGKEFDKAFAVGIAIMIAGLFSVMGTAIVQHMMDAFK